MWLWDKDEGDDSFVRVLIAEEINLQIYRQMLNETHIMASTFEKYYE